MQILRYILILTLLGMLNACAVVTPTDYTPANLPANNLNIIAADITPIIAAHNPPKSISFVIHHDVFGRILAQNLGKLGYKIILTNQISQESTPSPAKRIRYTIDYVSKTMMYIALTINNSQRYTRTYTINQDGHLTANPTQIIGVRNAR